ncbi:hypothetical protein D043_1953A, partial [Vibrio parahaemolyticus EKP-021]
MINQLDT